MFSGSGFKDFSYLVICLSSVSTPPHVLSVWGGGGNVCGLIAHISLGVVLLQLIQWGNYFVLSGTRTGRGLMGSFIAPLSGARGVGFLVSFLF